MEATSAYEAAYKAIVVDRGNKACIKDSTRTDLGLLSGLRTPIGLLYIRQSLLIVTHVFIGLCPSCQSFVVPRLCFKCSCALIDCLLVPSCIATTEHSSHQLAQHVICAVKWHKHLMLAGIVYVLQLPQCMAWTYFLAII